MEDDGRSRLHILGCSYDSLDLSRASILNKNGEPDIEVLSPTLIQGAWQGATCCSSGIGAGRHLAWPSAESLQTGWGEVLQMFMIFPEGLTSKR